MIKMGVDLRDIIPCETISFEDLKGKTLAIDALNSIHQFLASIRQPDGTPLMDAQGRVTSHLSGLLYRTIRLVKLEIKPIYVFDGKPPDLKKQEIQRRHEIKKEAEKEWLKAKQEGRIEDARKYAQRTSKLTTEMQEDSKKLLECMGIPYVQAPSEGEAQCAHMCLKGDAWGVGSQDYDALLFGSPRLVRSLTLSGSFDLNLISLDDTLKGLNLNREKLVDLALLVGTDFNDGVKGIGPKKALKIVREGKLNTITVDFDFEEAKKIFMNPQVTDEYSISWGGVKTDALVKLLCGEHDFGEERVVNAANELVEAYKGFSQQSLSRWFS